MNKVFFCWRYEDGYLEGLLSWKPEICIMKMVQLSSLWTWKFFRTEAETPVGLFEVLQIELGEFLGCIAYLRKMKIWRKLKVIIPAYHI